LNNLVLEIRNNQIINLNIIIESINLNEDIDLLRESLNGILSGKFNHLQNIEAIRVALERRIEFLEEIKLTNEEVIEEIKKKNPNLSGLSIIETGKTINDANRDVEYIKYVDIYDNVKILECGSANTLNEFINDPKNEDLFSNGSAEDIFNHFERNIHSSLVFNDIVEKTPENIKTELDRMRINNPIINNENAFVEETARISKYALDNHNGATPKISINSDGERIYNIGLEVIKFRDNDDVRKMEIISTDNERRVNLSNHEVTEEVKVENADSLTSEDEMRIREDALLNDTDFNNLLASLYKGELISDLEQDNMYTYISNAFEEMKNQTITYDRQNSIDMYMDYIKNKISDKDSKEELIFNAYHNIIEANQKVTEMEVSNDMKLKKVLLEDEKRAAFASIVLITSTIILGILFVLLLANR